MVSVKNIKRGSNNINLSKTKYKNLSKYIPSVSHKVLEFELVDTGCALANAIRRCLTNELPIKYLTCSLTDIKSDDAYIVDDIIKSRLEMIPIPQNLDMSKKYELKYFNSSETYVDINSCEIKYKGKQVDSLIPDIPLCSINSQCTLTISNIVVAESHGYLNGRVSPARIGYKIINHDMNKLSPINSDPKDFRLLVECSGVYDPDQLVLSALNEIEKRLDAIDFKQSKVEFGVYKLLIVGETHTIGNLLSRYVFDLKPSIDYVNMRITHPSIRECTLDVLDSNAENLIKDAIVKIKKDLNTISKSFK